jgi:hypothetical protein
MSLYDLLPPNSTQLERDLSRAVSFLPRLQNGPPTIRRAKNFVPAPGPRDGISAVVEDEWIWPESRVTIPAPPAGLTPHPAVLNWLAYELGLGEISGYFDDPLQLLIEGTSWQRIRGTPASILQALRWLDLTGAIDESEAGSYRWSEYQIGLQAATPDATTRDVISLAGISTPVRSRMSRVFAVYDFRRFVLDDSLLSEGGMLSDHSGARPDWANGTQISFGRVMYRRVDFGAVAAGAHTRERAGLVVLQDRFILSHSILCGTADEPAWHDLNLPVARDRQRFAVVDVGPLSREWDAQAWGAFAWSEPVATVVGGRYPP